jgi:hypothetical protein
VSFGGGALSVAATHLSLRSPFSMTLSAAGGAMFLLVGSLRMSSPGPIDYISGLDPRVGRVGVSRGQIAGTQGALPAGMVASAVWVATISIAGWRARSLPRLLVALGLVPLLYPVSAVVSRLGGGSDSGVVWVIAVASIFLGLPLWCLATGPTLLVRTRRARPSLGDVTVG